MDNWYGITYLLFQYHISIEFVFINIIGMENRQILLPML